MQKYFCNPCGYTYDPEKGDPDHGIAPGTKFEDLPDDWCCPLCGVSKSSPASTITTKYRQLQNNESKSMALSS